MDENERQAIIAEVRAVAAMTKTDHFCSRVCAECDRNTQIQMARNAMAELHPRARWMWN
jgi:hypothetical protein